MIDAKTAQPEVGERPAPGTDALATRLERIADADAHASTPDAAADPSAGPKIAQSRD
jgi:hypothetical protein